VNFRVDQKMVFGKILLIGGEMVGAIMSGASWEIDECGKNAQLIFISSWWPEITRLGFKRMI
jgi:hypothetical protein